MPQLGGELTFEQMVSEAALAGFQGTEVGGKFPTDPAVLNRALDLRGIKIASQWFSSFLCSTPYEENEKAFVKQLDAKTIIEGIGLDPRIGMHYCNPSFGYGGYCLPKDSNQLLKNFKDIPQSLIQAIIQSNQTRKKFIAKTATTLAKKRIGIYRLVMKSGSDNFRESAVLDIIKSLKEKGGSVVIYEPLLKENAFKGCPVINDLNVFAQQVELILANRKHPELLPYMDKVLTRDIWEQN